MSPRAAARIVLLAGALSLGAAWTTPARAETWCGATPAAVDVLVRAARESLRTGVERRGCRRSAARQEEPRLLRQPGGARRRRVRTGRGEGAAYRRSAGV